MVSRFAPRVAAARLCGISPRTTSAAAFLLLAALTLPATGCGSKSTEPTVSVLEGSASTKTAGPIAGATVKISYHGNGATADETGVEQATTTSNASGEFRFESLKAGWYSISINWTVGTITRNHGALESHSGYLVAHYSNGTALALGPEFEFPATSSVAFVYDN